MAQQQRIGACTVVTTNTSIGGQPVRYHTVRADSNAAFGLHEDPELAGYRVMFEPGDWLIDQAATTARIGRPAGFLPGDRLMAQRPGCLGFAPANFWQRGAILLHASSEGGPDLFAGSCPDGAYTFIVKGASGWEAATLKFRQNKPDQASQRTIDRAEMGFSMPLILKDGKVRHLSDYAGDPRVVGDPRNFADLGFGLKDLPPKFWLLIRRVMPSSAAGVLATLNDGGWLETRNSGVMTEAEFDEFKSIIDTRLYGRLRLERSGGKIHFTVIEPAPIQKIPAVGVGFDGRGQLIVVVVEGRQPHSVGVSCRRLAQLMLDEGAITGGLGAAGNDTGIWLNDDGKFQTISSGPYRQVPCLLIAG